MEVRPLFTLLVLLLGLLAPAPSTRAARARQGGPAVGRSAPPAGGLYHALVIGNDDYAHLPKLTTAAADARALARTLREIYGFQTTLLVNATRPQVVAALSDYGRKLGAESSLLVYYAGRGHGDAGAGKSYWLPVDATREDAPNRIAADEITAVIRAIPARHVLVVSDSCYSGALLTGVGAPPPLPPGREQFLRKMAAGRSRTLMTSGGEEPAGDEGGRSVFAAALLRGLRKMGGPRFTASELFVEHVLSPVAGRTGRIPAYNPLRDSGHEGGDFVFERVKPPDTSLPACEDVEAKRTLYKTFLDNHRGFPDNQKAAYEAGKEYVSRYDRCPGERDKNVVGYMRPWLAKYEAAVRIWEESQRRRGRQP